MPLTRSVASHGVLPKAQMTATSCVPAFIVAAPRLCRGPAGSSTECHRGRDRKCDRANFGAPLARPVAP
eukprot:9469615-Pyramimonas_sp.AAC.1